MTNYKNWIITVFKIAKEYLYIYCSCCVFFTMSSTMATPPLSISSPDSTPTSCSRLSICLLRFLTRSFSVPARSGWSSLHLTIVLCVPKSFSNSPGVIILLVPKSAPCASCSYTLCLFHTLRTKLF